MKKFFFDDIRDAPSSEWTLARSAPEARIALASDVYGVWSLDHDIGFDIINDPQEDGTALAEWAAANVRNWPQLIIIHSFNPAGAEAMARILMPFANVIAAPFGSSNYTRLIAQIEEA